MLDILDDYLVYRGYNHCRIDGQTVRNFPTTRVFCLETEFSGSLVFLLRLI